MNFPAVPQGKHTERPRGQRGKPRGGICRLCKTDGREERGQLSGVETGGSPDAATPPGPRDAPRRVPAAPGAPAPSPRCIVLPASGRVLHPQPPAARERHPPRGADRAPGGAEGGAQGARATLQQVARRGLGTRGLIQSARPVRPAPNSGSPAGPPPTPPQRGAHGFCFGGDENQDPRGGGAAAAGGSPAQG